jgi:hypothetical protein
MSLTMSLIVVGLLIVALFAVIIWRNRGPWTPPTRHQLYAATAGDTGTEPYYHRGLVGDGNFPGDGYDHDSDSNDSSDAGDDGGSDGGGGDGGGD